jgi:hypothetical protein
MVGMIVMCERETDLTKALEARKLPRIGMSGNQTRGRMRMLQVLLDIIVQVIL